MGAGARRSIPQTGSAPASRDDPMLGAAIRIVSIDYPQSLYAYDHERSQTYYAQPRNDGAIKKGGVIYTEAYKG